MTFYKKLNLPSNPLKDGAAEILFDLKDRSFGPNEQYRYQFINLDVAKFFKSELLDQLASLGLEPAYFCQFGSPNNQITSSTLHVDGCYYGTKFQLVNFGINWDLLPGTTDFVWYDCSERTIMPPRDRLTTNKYEFAGVLYKGSDWRDMTDAKELCRLSVDRNVPYLVRTNVPHRIWYTSAVPNRLCVSLRFNEQAIPTWERALEICEPLFAD